MADSEAAELSCRRRRRSSPAAFTSLPDDEGMLREILLRLPPQPSSLPRASAVCKRWRRLATDPKSQAAPGIFLNEYLPSKTWSRHCPKFIARFHAHHRKRPLLGVFQHGSQDIVFTPILDPPDRIPPRRFNLRICDGRGYLGAQLLGCRHGRVLAIDQVRAEVVLFDPITGEQRRLPVPLPPGFQIRTVRYLNGAVVCAAGDQGHVHGSCHSSPFKVVLVFMDSPDGRPRASVYSSETGMWGDLISAEAPSPVSCGGSASILIGNVLYWPLSFMMDDILEFDLDRQRLDVIKGPPGMDATQRHQIIQAEDGALGVALFTGINIQMFQRRVNCQGVATWLLWKIVHSHHSLGILPNIKRKRGWLGKFLGYDEYTNAMFLFAVDSVYMVQLKSLHSKKLYETSYSNAMPCHAFSSFYTPGTAITGGGAEMLHDS